MRLPLAPTAIRWGLSGLVVGVILYFSLLTTPAAPEQAGPFWDKKLHFLAYGTLTLTFAYATVPLRSRPVLRLSGVIVGAVAVGVGVEVLQGFVPMRQMSGLDAVANAVGILLASLWFAVERHFEYQTITLG